MYQDTKESVADLTFNLDIKKFTEGDLFCPPTKLYPPTSEVNETPDLGEGCS